MSKKTNSPYAATAEVIDLVNSDEEGPTVSHTSSKSDKREARPSSPSNGRAKRANKKQRYANKKQRHVAYGDRKSPPEIKEKCPLSDVEKKRLGDWIQRMKSDPRYDANKNLIDPLICLAKQIRHDTTHLVIAHGLCGIGEIIDLEGVTHCSHDVNWEKCPSVSALLGIQEAIIPSNITYPGAANGLTKMLECNGRRFCIRTEDCKHCKRIVIIEAEINAWILISFAEYCRPFGVPIALFNVGGGGVEIVFKRIMALKKDHLFKLFFVDGYHMSNFVRRRPCWKTGDDQYQAISKKGMALSDGFAKFNQVVVQRIQSLGGVCEMPESMIEQFDKNDVLRFCGRGGWKAIEKVAKARVPKKRVYAPKWNPGDYQRAQVKLGLHLFQQPAFIKANSERQRALVRLTLHIFQQPEFRLANKERQLALLRQGLHNFQNLTAKQAEKRLTNLKAAHLQKSMIYNNATAKQTVYCKEECAQSTVTGHNGNFSALSKGYMIYCNTCKKQHTYYDLKTFDQMKKINCMVPGCKGKKTGLNAENMPDGVQRVCQKHYKQKHRLRYGD